MQLEGWVENNRREQLRFQQESETARAVAAAESEDARIKSAVWLRFYEFLAQSKQSFIDAWLDRCFLFGAPPATDATSPDSAFAVPADAMAVMRTRNDLLSTLSLIRHYAIAEHRELLIAYCDNLMVGTKVLADDALRSPRYIATPDNGMVIRTPGSIGTAPATAPSSFISGMFSIRHSLNRADTHIYIPLLEHFNSTTDHLSLLLLDSQYDPPPPEDWEQTGGGQIIIYETLP